MARERDSDFYRWQSVRQADQHPMSYFGIPIRNGLPIGLGSVGPLASGGGSPFSPLSLFSSGAPGAWYDPSDYTTLFQNNTGTTPVTAVEQPVGLMLDKSQGLVLGTELVTNGDFSGGTTGWTANNTATLSSVSGGLQIVSSAVNQGTSQVVATTSGVRYKVVITVVSATANYNIGYGNGFGLGQLLDSGALSGARTFTAYIAGNGTAATFWFYAAAAGTYLIDNVSIKVISGNHAFQATSASRPVLSARYNLLTSTATLATQSVTTRAATHTLTFTGAGSITLSGTAIGVYTAGTYSVVTTAGSLTLTVAGAVTQADLRETNNGVGLPVYQAVVTASNYDTAGFLPYLKFDGVDDGMLTSSISFTATDKMSVFAGVRKLSDAARGMIVELSATSASNNGSFGMTAPNAASATYAFESKGTVLTDAIGTPFVAPLTSVLSGLSAILTDANILRVNGVQADSDTGNQGTGNYGNYPLYIGRRGGTTLPLNGQLYSMIIVGKAVTASELTNTETYVNQKTGAY